MTVAPTGNTGYALWCDAEPGGALGSGSGIIDRNVVLYSLSYVLGSDVVTRGCLRLRSVLAVLLWLCVLYRIARAFMRS